MGINVGVCTKWKKRQSFTRIRLEYLSILSRSSPNTRLHSHPQSRLPHHRPLIYNIDVSSGGFTLSCSHVKNVQKFQLIQ